MKLGIGSYTYGWGFSPAAAGTSGALDVWRLLQRARDLGAAVVQIADNAFPERLSPTQLDELRRQAAAAGIDVEVGARGLDAANLGAHIAIAARLEARLLRFVIDAPDYAPTLTQVAALLRTALPQLTAAGITLAIENHDRFQAAEFAALVREVDSPAVGICLDTANSFGALEGPGVVVEALAPFTVNLHLKDFVVRRVPSLMGFVIEGTPAGEGRLDLPALLPALAAFGRCNTAILELWTPPAATLAETLRREAEWAVRSIATLRAMGAFAPLPQ